MRALSLVSEWTRNDLALSLICRLPTEPSSSVALITDTKRVLDFGSRRFEIAIH